MKYSRIKGKYCVGRLHYNEENSRPRQQPFWLRWIPSILHFATVDALPVILILLQFILQQGVHQRGFTRYERRAPVTTVIDSQPSVLQVSFTSISTRREHIYHAKSGERSRQPTPEAQMGNSRNDWCPFKKDASISFSSASCRWMIPLICFADNAEHHTHRKQKWRRKICMVLENIQIQIASNNRY